MVITARVWQRTRAYSFRVDAFKDSWQAQGCGRLFQRRLRGLDVIPQMVLE
jgi:hypothetical protein